MAEMNGNRAVINPQKFSLWLAMASILMLFGGFSSAYIVKQSAGNWLEFPLPSYFFISAVTMLISSVTLHLSLQAYKKQNKAQYQGLLVATLVLGLVFIVFQILGWTALFEKGIDFKVNVAGSFLYIITGVHAAHVLGGIVALVVAMIHAFSLDFEYKEFRKNRFELVVQYWHFVDILWIFLLVFLLTSK